MAGAKRRSLARARPKMASGASSSYSLQPLVACAGDRSIAGGGPPQCSLCSYPPSMWNSTLEHLHPRERPTITILASPFSKATLQVPNRASRRGRPPSSPIHASLGSAPVHRVAWALACTSGAHRAQISAARVSEMAGSSQSVWPVAARPNFQPQWVVQEVLGSGAPTNTR